MTSAVRGTVISAGVGVVSRVGVSSVDVGERGC